MGRQKTPPDFPDVRVVAWLVVEASDFLALETSWIVSLPWVISHVPMFHITQPLGIYGLLDGYYKVMSNSPKMGHLPIPVYPLINQHNYGKIHHVFNGKTHYFDWAIFKSYVKLPEGMLFGVSPTKTHRIAFLIMVDWSESFDSRTQRHGWRKVSMGFAQEKL